MVFKLQFCIKQPFVIIGGQNNLLWMIRRMKRNIAQFDNILPTISRQGSYFLPK
jgi:hypothetical protein